MAAITAKGIPDISIDFSLKSENKSSSSKTMQAVAGSWRLFCSMLTITSGIKCLINSDINHNCKQVAKRVTNACQRFFQNVRDFIFVNYYNKIYGALYVASGICAITASFHDLKWIDLKKAYGIVNAVELGTFITATLMGLYNHVALYQNASNLSKPEMVERAKTSAILGIVCCVGYIVNCTLLLTGQLMTVAFIIGLLAFLTGFVKALYDNMRPVATT